MGKPISFAAKQGHRSLTSWGFGVDRSRCLSALELSFLADNFSEPSDYEKRVMGKKYSD